MNFLRLGSSKSKDKDESGHSNSEDILKAKGIWSYFQNIDPDILSKRVMSGWLRKRSKGKTKYFQNRWFILVSARQIRNDCPLDEEILSVSQLPPWMELETIYYFDDKEILTESKYLKNIVLQDCNGVIVKDMTKSKDKGFTFKIDMGETIYHLNAETLKENQQWTVAIELSKATAQQQARSRDGGLKKNIALIEKIHAEGGVSKLQDKIIDDYLRITMEYPIEDFDNLDEFLQQNEKVLEDFKATADACLALDPPRKDIIEEYFPIYHEKTIQMPTIYYESNKASLQNMDIIKILNWLFSYTDSLSLFGIKDERLTNSIKSLSSLLTKKMLKTGTSMIFNILLEMRDSTTCEIVDGLKQTNGPLDLFKILNETFETYKRCRYKEVAEKMLIIMKKEIVYYQSYLEILLKDQKFTVERYIGLSNDTLAYIRNVNDFASNAAHVTGLDEIEVEKLLDKEEVVRKFVHIGNLAFEKLVDAAFWNLAGHFKVNFMDLKSDVVLGNILQPLSDIIASLHKSYSLKVWKLCFEKVIILYMQCLLNSASKLKVKEISVLSERLALDRDIFEGTFKVGASVMEACLKVINDILDFFDTSPAIIPMSILEFRRTNGPGFNMTTVKALLNLRVDLTSSERSEALQGCKELLSNYKEEKGQPSSGGLLQRIEVEKQEGDEDDDIKVEEVEEEEVKVEEDVKEEKQEEKKGDPNKLGLKALEGYLEKKSAGFTKAWEKRYFAIKNGKLYWYNNDRAREALNHLDLKNVHDCVAKKEKKFTFQYENKTYKLKAPNRADRDKWVQVIHELVEDLNCTDPRVKYENDLLKIMHGGSLFVDYETEWKPNPDEISVLKKQKDSRVLEGGRVNRAITFSMKSPKKKEPEAMKEQDRRKSITFDDDEFA